MADVLSLPSWTGRASTQSISDNLVAIDVDFDGSKLNAAVTVGGHIGLCEIPFGSTVLDAMFRATTTAGGAATGTVGVLGNTSYTTSGFNDSGSTGNDVDGLIVPMHGPVRATPGMSTWLVEAPGGPTSGGTANTA